MAENESVVKTASDPERKAIAFAWLFHLVGDIHQPLHTAQLFTVDYPQGDRGGNEICVHVTQAGQPMDLHRFWDGVITSSSNLTRLRSPRAVEIDVAANMNKAFVYAKMCKLILLGFIERPRSTQWRGTRIAMKQGVIEPGQFVISKEFVNFLVARAQNMAELGAQISERQKAKVQSRMQSDLDRVAQSDDFAAMMQDVAMFGSGSFWEDEC
jgi:hypothetical protein